jgi:tripartite-type tricarboxylate transporter receptor subunit TctC
MTSRTISAMLPGLMTSRTIPMLAAALLMLAAEVAPVQAQQKARAPDDAANAFPARPVRIIVGSAPGGGADITARAVAQKLTETWGRSVIVENRSGTALYALEATAAATADGYTMGMATFNSYLLGIVSPSLRFDLARDLQAVSQLTSQAYLFVVHPSVTGNTLKEVVAFSKTRPGKLNYASSGAGGVGHLGMELLKSMTGLDALHVPYRGIGPGIIDLLGGQVHMALGSAPSASPHVRSGKLRAVAVTTEKRSAFLPDVPTVAESGVSGFALNGWYGLVAPRAISPVLLARLHQSVTQALGSPDIQTRFAADGSEAAPSASPAEFRNLIAREMATWEKFVRTSGFKH